jgi:hypothetical protein
MEDIMTLLPDEPRLGDPKLPDPLPDDGFDRNMYTIVAIAAAILLVAFVVGVPDQMGHIPVPAAPTVTP